MHILGGAGMGNNNPFCTHFQDLANLHLIGTGYPYHRGDAGKLGCHDEFFHIVRAVKGAMLQIKIDKVISIISDGFHSTGCSGKTGDAEYRTFFHTFAKCHSDSFS
ncbi:hypothetical protein SDC9_108990 [bioreactor metagenome]|uniref:Uncharacterized protein n=1 Tax=bioreactor metagenome TaxID=1076179 RepID=A0A645BK27_9ZZZZ